jgi:2-oxoglutarate ferredoxin oxidoreductase subunit beta
MSATCAKKIGRNVDVILLSGDIAYAGHEKDRIACGILYQREDIPDFYDRLVPRQGLETTCVEEVRRYDVSEYWKQLV